jgi:hypothetical protein
MPLDGSPEGPRAVALCTAEESLRNAISPSTLSRDTRSDDRVTEKQMVIGAYPLDCVREVGKDVAGQWLQLH